MEYIPLKSEEFINLAQAIATARYWGKKFMEATEPLIAPTDEELLEGRN